ncbi:MAG: 50S ribosomal protein L10 [Chloroflexota bacterium]|nr:50S ribosomal protein L10 [Chloroflexota bacterium]
MPTAKKAAVIDDLTEKLGRINAAALIEYRGLTVDEIGDLRTQLRQRDVELTVTKNTLLRQAAHRNDMTELDDLFSGPNAVAFMYGDEAAGTKALNDYFRTARVGEVKGGILKGGRRLTADQFTKLADLPNRPTLLGQIAGLLESPLSQLAALFNAPAQQLAYALANFEERGGAGATGVNGAPAPAVDAAPTAEAPEATPEAVDAAATEVSAAPVVDEVSAVPTVDSAIPDAEISGPSAVESDATGTAAEPQPAGTAPVDDAAGEDMSTPPVVTDEAVSTEAAPNVEQPLTEPAEVVASDVSRAPEEETDTGATTVRFSAPLPSGQDAAADPTSAPESEGSASQ